MRYLIASLALIIILSILAGCAVNDDTGSVIGYTPPAPNTPDDSVWDKTLLTPIKELNDPPAGITMSLISWVG